MSATPIVDQFTNPLGVGKGGPTKSKAILTSKLNQALGLDKKNLTPAKPTAQKGDFNAPKLSDQEAQRAAAEELQRLRKQRGRAATIIGDDTGDSGGIAAKQLLGA